MRQLLTFSVVVYTQTLGIFENWTDYCSIFGGNIFLLLCLAEIANFLVELAVMCIRVYTLLNSCHCHIIVILRDITTPVSGP